MAHKKSNGCLIVAEIAQAHDGSLALAHSYIDAVKGAGADAVKFQTHIAEAESSPLEPWRKKFPTQDKTRFDYWKRMEFSEPDWRALRAHAHKRSLKFISSPFSVEAVDLLKRVGVDAWKIPSGEITNPLLLKGVLRTKQPIILSTGMSPLSEIDAVVKTIQKNRSPLTVLQCASYYPCPPEKIGLNMLLDFRKRYRCHVGLSDHSGTIFSGLAAAALGIDMIEVHVMFDKKMFSPDAPASITIEDLKTLVAGIRFIETMNAHPIDKNKTAQNLKPMRRKFMKSIVARTNLPKGTRLIESHLTLKKPGLGLPATELFKILGRTLRRNVGKDQFLSIQDIGGLR